MKKLIAKLSAVALLAALVVVPETQAAAINGATAVVTNDGGDGEFITVTGSGSSVFPNGSNDITSATIKTLTGATVTGVTFTYSAGTNDNSILTINGTGLNNNTSYILSFNTALGDFGTIQISVGNPANSQVTVTATVEPTLTFDLNTYSIALGTLIADQTATGAVVATTRTNAQGGLVIKMDATGLATGNTDTDKHIGTLQRNSSVETTPTDDTYKVVSTTTGGGGTLTERDVATTQDVLTATSLADANTTTTVEIRAMSRAKTEAGDYDDTLTFSATATF